MTISCAKCSNVLEFQNEEDNTEEMRRFMGWSEIDGLTLCQYCNDKGDPPSVNPVGEADEDEAGEDNG